MATRGSVSKETCDYECTVCLKSNTVRKADRYCIDCQKYMCTDCLSLHNNFGDKHNVLNATDPKVHTLLTEKCEDHPDRVLEYYCLNHDELLCQTCLLDHRTCATYNKVKDIRKAVDELSAARHIKDFPGLLQSALDRIERAIETLDQYVLNIQQKKQTFLADLEQYARTILSKVEELRKRGEDVISCMEYKLTSTAMENRQKCVQARDKIQKCTEEIKRSTKKKPHLIVVKKQGQKITKQADVVCNNATYMMKNSPFCFKINTNLLKELNTLIVGNEYACSFMANINVRIPEDHDTCRIVGCCLLPNGDVLLLDNFNGRLKRIDITEKSVIDHCKTEGIALCTFGTGHVAVSMDGWLSYYLQIFSYVDKLSPTRTIKLKHKATGMVCHGGKLFTGHTRTIYVYDMNGKLEREISLSSEIFRGITMNKSGDTIFVASSELTCLSRDRTIFSITESDLGISPDVLAMDQKGHVFVGSTNSPTILQVTEEGRIVGQILSEKTGILNPWCLCYDFKRNALYVGGYSGQLLCFELT